MLFEQASECAQVIVVEDENGNIVRESMKDTDVVARYKTMHETLVYLCHLDHEDTEAQMLEKLRVHVSHLLIKFEPSLQESGIFIYLRGSLACSAGKLAGVCLSCFSTPVRRIVQNLLGLAFSN